MAEPLLDLLEELRAAVGRVTAREAAARIRLTLDAGPDALRFALHRWFAVQRSLAANASERRFLDETEALVLWPSVAPALDEPSPAVLLAPPGPHRPTA
jgi:hypothetical protein